jgi:hypothetical protein
MSERQGQLWSAATRRRFQGTDKSAHTKFFRLPPHAKFHILTRSNRNVSVTQFMRFIDVH